MRRRLSSVAVLPAALTLLATPSLDAQDGLTTEGAPFLLIPVGARALGMGQAVVALQGGTEAVWWNPSALARAADTEVAVHHYQSFVGNGDVISLLHPSRKLGTFAASVYILDYGKQSIAEEQGSPVSPGDILPRNLVYALTYATAIGGRLNAGLTVKVVQLRIDCSGNCVGIPTTAASTTAFDIGAQYDLRGFLPVTVGIAVRHLGPRMQVNDDGQADPLPTRVQVGMMYRLTSIARYIPDTEMRFAADVVDAVRDSDPEARLGAELGWRQRAYLRGGYVHNSSELSGPSLGLGLVAGKLHVDIARIFEGFSGDASESPTYVSLRYLF